MARGNDKQAIFHIEDDYLRMVDGKRRGQTQRWARCAVKRQSQCFLGWVSLGSDLGQTWLYPSSLIVGSQTNRKLAFRHLIGSIVIDTL